MKTCYGLQLQKGHQLKTERETERDRLVSGVCKRVTKRGSLVLGVYNCFQTAVDMMLAHLAHLVQILSVAWALEGEYRGCF